MTERLNQYGQPIGPDVAGWTPRSVPPRTAMQGRTCRVEPLDPDRHAAALFAAVAEAPDDRLWTYMAQGPFASEAAFRAWMDASALGDDPLFHAVIDTATDRATGHAALMRIEPAVGCIEVGNILFAPALQRTVAATECMYLMMRRVFDELGYRRYEWKCDALNAPSRAAALRLGFQYEGIFRQAILYKGRNRDTAWFSIIDKDWPGLKAGFEAWLDPANFDDAGGQKQPLAAFMPGAG